MAVQLSIFRFGDVFSAAAEFLLHLLVQGGVWCFAMQRAEPLDDVFSEICFAFPSPRTKILPLGLAAVDFFFKIALEIKTFYIKDYPKYLFAADNQRCSWFIGIFQVKRR